MLACPAQCRNSRPVTHVAKRHVLLRFPPALASPHKVRVYPRSLKHEYRIPRTA